MPKFIVIILSTLEIAQCTLFNLNISHLGCTHADEGLLYLSSYFLIFVSKYLGNKYTYILISNESIGLFLHCQD